MPRIFIAIALPASVKSEIGRLTDKLQKLSWPVKWEQPDKLHVTLRFLGSITREQLEKIENIVSRAVHRQAPLIVIDGFTALPNFSSPKILALNIVPNALLTGLQATIAQDCDKQRIGKPDKHPFTGHVTLGRFKSSSVNLGVMSMISFTASFPVLSVDVMASVLKPNGSEYTILTSYFLQG